MKKRNIYLIYLILLSSSVVMSQSRNGLYLEKYQLGSGLKFNSYSNEYEFKISGVVQTTYELKGLTDFEEFNSRFRVRRARLAVEGKIRRAKLSWRIKTDFGLPFGNSNEELNNGALLDAFITYQPIPQVKITVGQRSLFSDNRELRMSSTGLSFVERSRVTSAMAAIRDFGLFIETKHGHRKFRVKTA